MRQLLDAQGVAETIDGLARSIDRQTVPGSEPFFVGIRTRGAPLARRLAQKLQRPPDAVGVLDITLYRDDLGGSRHWPILRGTEIPFEIDDRWIVLVDDVLFTGRTTRAAIDALCDLGRPSVLRLAVLVDRGHRELPIQADYAGLVVATAPGDRINVRLRETDGIEEVVLL